MSHYLVDRIKSTENITVIGDSEIVAVHGNGHLERLDVRNAETGETRSLEGSALFIFIGVAPRTEAFASLVATDEKGFILTGADVRAAGEALGARPRPADVRDQRARRLRRRRRPRQRQPPHRRGRRRRLGRDLFDSPVSAERLRSAGER